MAAKKVPIVRLFYVSEEVSKGHTNKMKDQANGCLKRKRGFRDLL